MLRSKFPGGGIVDLVARAVGTGGFAHLCALLFAGYTGIELVIVPYKGQPQAIPDLMSGQISLMVLANTFVIPHVKTGKLKALAVTGPTRVKDLPEVPTIVEAGFPLEIGAVQWFGFVAPAGTPKTIISGFNAEVTKALKSPDVIDRLDKMSLAAATKRRLTSIAFPLNVVSRIAAARCHRRGRDDDAEVAEQYTQPVRVRRRCIGVGVCCRSPPRRRCR